MGIVDSVGNKHLRQTLAPCVTSGCTLPGFSANAGGDVTGASVRRGGVSKVIANKATTEQLGSEEWRIDKPQPICNSST